MVPSRPEHDDVTPPVIAFATDLSGDDAAAFVHACALAAASQARLVTLHGNARDLDVARLPDATVMSERWRRPIESARLVHECCDDVADTVIDALERIAPGLVVTGTHARHGVSALLHASVAEAIARNVKVPTLIVQNASHGFADAATGALALHRIVVPAGTRAEAIAGITAARVLLDLVHLTDVDIVVVHAATPGEPFDLGGLPIAVVQIAGKLEDVVLSVEREQSAQLIVMVSRGHDSVLDVLRGSHTEHVIRAAGCPVLFVPI